MKLEGVRTCPICKNRYNWYFLLQEHKSGYLYDVENISKYQCQAIETKSHDDDIYHLSTICPACYTPERFDCPRKN